MNKNILIAILTIAMFLVGCGGGSNTGNPIAPSLPEPAVQSTQRNSHVLWGLWEINIEQDGSGVGHVEALPLRGAMFNANVQMFLTPPHAPVNLLTFELLPATNLPSGYVEVRVGLRHPFPGVSKFRGFDVRAIAMLGSDTVDTYNTDILFGKPDPSGMAKSVGYMLNPDGYTRWWNASEFTDQVSLLSYKPSPLGTNPAPDSTLNPYKYFADELLPDTPVSSMSPDNRGTFSTSASVNTRDYFIQFPNNPPLFSFNLAVDASWAEPDPAYEPDGYPVMAFPPAAQTQEPYLVEAVQTGGDAFYNNGIFGGSIDLEVTVYDWQLVGQPSDVSEELSSLWLSGAPLLQPVDILPIANVLPGPNDVSRICEVTISSAMIDFQSAGSFMVLGTAESVDPATYVPQIDGGENIIFPDGVLSAYFMVELAIDSNIPTFKVNSPNGGESWVIGTEQTIEWTGGEPFETVSIEYSKDDFVSDINQVATGIPNTGIYVWDSVPDDISDTVKIRVRSSDFPSVYDDSDDYFKIVASLLERIVYASDNPAGGGGRQIWSIDPEGLTAPEQWSHNYSAMFNECPKLSPDGQYILYASVDMDSAKMILVDISTGTETDITPVGFQAVYGDFSHDGTKIVSAMTTGPWYGDRYLYTCDYAGENVELVNVAGGNVWAPEFSFDDSKIVFQDFATSQLCIYDYAADEYTQYTDNGTWNDDPHFSPDGTQIAWASAYPSSGRHIWVSPIESWDPNDYEIDFYDFIRSPCFSPDGEFIVFDWGSMAGSEIAVYTVATGTYVNITNDGFGDYQADWGYMIPH